MPHPCALFAQGWDSTDAARRVFFSFGSQEVKRPTLSQRTRKDGAPSDSEEIKGGPPGQKEKAIEISLNGLYLSRRRPTLPHTFGCSTIGPAGLNLRRFAGVSEAGARSRNPERFVRGILRYNSLLSGFRRYDAMSAPTPIWIISVALLMLACDRTEPPGNHWRVGGLYSTDDGTGQFSVVKILMLEPDVVHLRIYKEKFASRPTTVDPN